MTYDNEDKVKNNKKNMFAKEKKTDKAKELVTPYTEFFLPLPDSTHLPLFCIIFQLATQSPPIKFSKVNLLPKTHSVLSL